ncbi:MULTISPECIES: hypothetical protein [unclassified Chelatococcus]|uniref:hypothetical protein n=1 Tax=unclassified Chelatococcus TaxID=2638111 RepID=UPI001BD198ED|nr:MULTISPECIES: hypothetical protein [unclassified Chelatococcus]MBS7697259.1 hypothetical protein [Chelatococcus sp. YT9]MBX3556444.1 hypothetical protein [Chelatococcus sp.]
MEIVTAGNLTSLAAVPPPLPSARGLEAAGPIIPASAAGLQYLATCVSRTVRHAPVWPGSTLPHLHTS